MSLSDVTDTALIAELRSAAEAATAELAAWQRRARSALQLAEIEGRALAAARDEARSWRLQSGDLRERLARTEREMLGISHTLDEAMLVNAEHLRRIVELEREVEELRCGDLLRFHDGDLEPTRAEKFRAHLASCEDCQRGLVEHARLDAMLRLVSAARRGGG